MEVKAYGLFKALGLIDYNEATGEGTVSRRAIELYEAMASVWLVFMLLGMLAIGMLLARRFAKQEKPEKIRLAVQIVTAVWLTVGILQAVGIGPYLEFYPTQFSGGFLDLSVIGHIFIGVIYALSALCFFVGTRIGKKIGYQKKG